MKNHNMNIHTWLFISIFLSLNGNILFANKNLFFEGSFYAAKQKAKYENKIVLLDFTARWCLPCQEMEKHTFLNPEVEDFLNNNAIVYKIDINDLDGINYKNEYKIKLLPTLVLLDTKGKTISRREESLSPEMLIKWLQQIMEENELVPIKQQRMSDLLKNQNKNVSAKEDLSAVIDKNDMDNLTTEKEIKSDDNKTQNHAKLKSNNVINKQNSTLYYIQTGVYAQINNAQLQLKKLTAKYKQEPKIMEDKDDKGNKIYRITLGIYDTKEEAVLFQQYLKKSGTQSTLKIINKS